ncbi:hypothetical protein [Tateyamaria sp.]|uniref:hypothetical protein n=1 Tax=Tateyamaria sp. TaxID=1929288 RepID=UPI00329C1A16
MSDKLTNRVSEKIAGIDKALGSGDAKSIENIKSDFLELKSMLSGITEAQLEEARKNVEKHHELENTMAVMIMVAFD